MNISSNKKLPFSKNKFYNIIKGKKSNGYFFILPAFCISPTKNLSWDISLFSIFLSWGKYYCQFNVCEIIRDNKEDILKSDILNIINMLRSHNLGVSDMSEMLAFVKKNKHIITIAKNSDLTHPYIQNVMLSHFQYQTFIVDNSNNETNQPIQDF